MKDDLAAFRSIHHPHAMRDWLDGQRAVTIKAMMVERDVIGLHQAQGRLQLLERMAALMDQAHPR